MKYESLSFIEEQLYLIQRGIERIALALEVKNETSQKEEKEEATEI